MKSRYWILTPAAVIVLAVAWWVGRPDQTVVAPPAGAGREPSVKTAQAPATEAVSIETPAEKDDSLDRLRARMMARYGSHIDDAVFQIRFLDEMIRYLRQVDAGHWRENLEALLRSWFPQLADTLLKRLQAMLDYQQWLHGQRSILGPMTPEQRHDFLWNKRRELFGKAADEIWQAEERNYRLTESLKRIDGLGGTPQSKARSFVQAIQSTYGQQAPTLMAEHRQEITDHFLTLSSVQEDLGRQNAPQRNQTLTRIRRTLGMDDQAIARWHQLDEHRDSLWAKGHSYEAQRAQLMDSLAPGPKRSQALDQLRRSLFDSDMADTLADEEASGFHRFQQPRVFGQD